MPTSSRVSLPRIGLPAADLSGVPNFARRGTEFRVGVRALYVTPFGEDLGLLGDGTGDGFFIVYRPEESGDLEGDVSMEIVLERSAHDWHDEDGTGRAAEYWRACAGFRWMDVWTNWSEPFLSAGGSYSQIEVSGGDLMAGAGLYGGVGVEFLLARAASAAIEAKFHTFWGSGGGSAAVLAVALGARF